MTAVPLLPKNAPFSPEEINVLNEVVSRTTPLQRGWLAGFFAGFEAAQGGQAAPAAAARPRVPLTVLYTSESGNAEGLAIKAKKAAQKHGLDARVVDMADADMGLLAKAKNLVVYASTWGEGDPPSRAADFYHALAARSADRVVRERAERGRTLRRLRDPRRIRHGHAGRQPFPRRCETRRLNRPVCGDRTPVARQ